jgi:hypothetical protein
MNTNPLQQFRDTVYQALPKRADTTMDLLDALTSSLQVTAPVALSESPLFRRGFAAVYDVLEEGELPEEALRELFSRSQPATCETLADYELYAVDCTPCPRPEAETLPGRVNLKSQAKQVAQVGEKLSWLGRLVKTGSSWVAPQDIQRVDVTSTDSLVGMVLRVEFLKADDTPRYKTPLYHFWTGPFTVPLEDLCRMSLWRFAIEHAFRFLKQRLGLNTAQSTNPHAIAQWQGLTALAYWQLLLSEKG